MAFSILAVSCAFSHDHVIREESDRPRPPGHRRTARRRGTASGFTQQVSGFCRSRSHRNSLRPECAALSRVTRASCKRPCMPDLPPARPSDPKIACGSSSSFRPLLSRGILMGSRTSQGNKRITPFSGSSRSPSAFVPKPRFPLATREEGGITARTAGKHVAMSKRSEIRAQPFASRSRGRRQAPVPRARRFRLGVLGHRSQALLGTIPHFLCAHNARNQILCDERENRRTPDPNTRRGSGSSAIASRKKASACGLC
jgi:hypothetical protein